MITPCEPTTLETRCLSTPSSSARAGQSIGVCFAKLARRHPRRACRPWAPKGSPVLIRNIPYTMRTGKERDSVEIGTTMESKRITLERFEAVVDAVPHNTLGMGYTLGAVSYIVARGRSGTHHGAPYEKPAHILIKTPEKRFRVEATDGEPALACDPTGGFDFAPITKEDVLRELEGHIAALIAHIDDLRGQQETEIVATRASAPADVEACVAALLPTRDAAEHEGVARAVMQALTDPQAYVAAHRAALARRGIERPIPHLHIIALADAMIHLGAAAEVDWNADAETVCWRVSNLAYRQDLGVTVRAVPSDPKLQTHEVLGELAAVLDAQGCALSTIDTASDAYVLHLLPSADYDEAAVRAAKIGVRLHRFPVRGEAVSRTYGG